MRKQLIALAVLFAGLFVFGEREYLVGSFGSQ